MDCMWHITQNHADLITAWLASVGMLILDTQNLIIHLAGVTMLIPGGRYYIGSTENPEGIGWFATNLYPS